MRGLLWEEERVLPERKQRLACNATRAAIAASALEQVGVHIIDCQHVRRRTIDQCFPHKN